MARTGSEHHSKQNITSRPKISQRKSSFSETLNKFTTNTFNRRCTDTGIPSSNSSASFNHHSRIPTPAGVDRSASFFSTLNTFASKSTASTGQETSQPSHTKRSRKISERLTRTPFFSHQYQQQSTVTPRSNRESSVKIEQRGLMQPVQPPLPRSSTIGSLGQSQQSSPHTPSFMRPTTSSARRSSVAGRSNTAAPISMTGHGSGVLQRQRDSSLRTNAGSSSASKTPTQARQVPVGTFPTRSDSLVSAPRFTDGPAPAFEPDASAKHPDMPTDYSDGANFQVADQPTLEMPKARESGNGKPKTSTDHMHQSHQAPLSKESKRGILKSKNKNSKTSKFSEGLSNLYVEDEADISKEELTNDEIKPRSNQGSPDVSERTATPDSSNPRLVTISPTQSYPLASYPHRYFFSAHKTPSLSPQLIPANAPPPPDPRSPTSHVVARPLHRPLRPLPHRRPPLPSLIALQTRILLQRRRRTRRNRPHLRFQLQRKPPHARHGPPQPPRLHPSALSVHD